MKKKILSLALLMLMLLTACSGGANKANDANGDANANGGNNGAAADAGEIDKSKTYIVGMDDTFAPMGFRDEKGDLVGFDVDLAQKVAEKIGIQVECQAIDWTMKESELESGNIDMIWNGYSITPEREKKVLLSEPYMDNRQIIITMKDSPVNSKADLADKRVTVQGESSALEAVMKDEAFVSALAEPPVEYATNTECFKDIEAKRCDAIVVDEVLARYYMKQNGEENYKVLEDNFGEEQFAVGMRKDDTALMDALNQAMKELREDGTYDEIYQKYFAD
ncbi:putative lysine-arginine-ornithine-binding periplasmic protein [Aedoeadaptatus nemausensis]|uniref:Putative lysine-arginine-ornithine-binding periplasmic protein n=1 Tax=Aedoeadaptatus nemausensis TaxID=2582829 RepID=A0A6V6XZ72_9FIRM|nr:amino acid ABC transporter substrate-binding protein [Peptoniphilus nemausensis]CAC9922280.1 putative lysine-arginine-ornithine-binding periplasmic protein [Peptoniphilus nemausensis]